MFFFFIKSFIQMYQKLTMNLAVQNSPLKWIIRKSINMRISAVKAEAIIKVDEHQ